LIIAGPDEGGHRAEVERVVKARGLEEIVQFVGPIPDQEKWRIYRSADLFVLPTFSENFGSVVAEALGCEVPVITTRCAPWSEIERAKCGWWVDPCTEAIASALEMAVATHPDDLRQMGVRGRDLVRRQYSWCRVAKQMNDLYCWVLGDGDRPDSVLDGGTGT
jgi:glycosyltransferase involved in cell wall biosynthesis